MTVPAWKIQAQLVPRRLRRQDDPAAGAAPDVAAGRRRSSAKCRAATRSMSRSRKRSPRSSRRRRRRCPSRPARGPRPRWPGAGCAATCVAGSAYCLRTSGICRLVGLVLFLVEAAAVDVASAPEQHVSRSDKPRSYSMKSLPSTRPKGANDLPKMLCVAPASHVARSLCRRPCSGDQRSPGSAASLCRLPSATKSTFCAPAAIGRAGRARACGP